MLTGRRLFEGDSVPETLAGVLKSEIDLEALLPPEVPAAIRRLLRRCLERNPKNRLHDIADARIVIGEVLAEPDLGRSIRSEGARASTSPRSRLPWALAALDGTRGRWQVSSDGGYSPRWRGDGRELFYLAPSDRLMSVTVEPAAESGGTPRLGRPVEVFQRVLADFDPAPDGQSFVELLLSGTGNRPLTLVTNWSAGLPR